MDFHLQVDPDVPSPDAPKFRYFLHWLVTNIPGVDVQRGDVAVPYMGPVSQLPLSCRCSSICQQNLLEAIRIFCQYALIAEFHHGRAVAALVMLKTVLFTAKCRVGHCDLGSEMHWQKSHY